MLSLLKNKWLWVVVICLVIAVGYLLFDIKGVIGSIAILLGFGKKQFDVHTKDSILKEKSDKLKNEISDLDKKEKQVDNNKELSPDEMKDYWKEQ